MEGLRFVLLVSVLALSAHSIYGATIGPVYPAPGENTFTSSSGATLSHGSFNSSSNSQLFGGMQDVQNVYSSNFSVGTGDTSFSNYYNLTVVGEWDSTEGISGYSGVGLEATGNSSPVGTGGDGQTSLNTPLVIATPEPVSLVLVGTGLLMCGLVRRRILQR